MRWPEASLIYLMDHINIQNPSNSIPRVNIPITEISWIYNSVLFQIISNCIPEARSIPYNIWYPSQLILISIFSLVTYPFKLYIPNSSILSPISRSLKAPLPSVEDTSHGLRFRCDKLNFMLGYSFIRVPLPMARLYNLNFLTLAPMVQQ